MNNLLVSKILVIEDDKLLSSIIKANFSSSYKIEIADNGSYGLFLLKQNSYDLLILDISIPQLSGFDILEFLRKGNYFLPIIMISTNTLSTNVIKTYKEGVNLFHPKPINFDLLAAQIESLLNNKKIRTIKLKFGIQLNIEKQMLFVDHNQIKLTKKEYKLVYLLFTSMGKILSRDTIIDKTNQFIFDVSSGSIDTIVSRIRTKIKKYYSKSEIIETVHGLGYRLNPDLVIN